MQRRTATKLPFGWISLLAIITWISKGRGVLKFSIHKLMKLNWRVENFIDTSSFNSDLINPPPLLLLTILPFHLLLPSSYRSLYTYYLTETYNSSKTVSPTPLIQRAHGKRLNLYFNRGHVQLLHFITRQSIVLAASLITDWTESLVQVRNGSPMLAKSGGRVPMGLVAKFQPS